MFENLQEKLQRAFKSLRGQARLSEENIGEALREIRLALLEADVNFKVVKELIDRIQAKAVGQEVLTALSPGEQVIKIVRDELVETLGKDTARMKFASQPPTVVLMAGLQGSGKTTTSGKLANWFKTGGHRPLLVSVDVYRPAAREQLKVVAQAVNTRAAHTSGGAVGEGSAPRGHRLRLRRADRRHRRTSAHRRRSYERDAVAEEAAESIRDSVRCRRHDRTGCGPLRR
jgi:signal recognition particle subunit SRP54